MSSQDHLELLSEGILQVIGRRPTPAEVSAFDRYLTLLLRWNRRHRLTGYRDPLAIVDRLLLDSLLFLRWLGEGELDVLDFGTGAGIPGLPLRIVEPRLRVAFLESRRRAISFLALVIRELGLEGVRLLHGRAEEMLCSDPALRAAFHAVVLRGAGPLQTILPVAMAFVRTGGRLITSGPPEAQSLPSLPAGITARWEVVTVKGRRPRRFLVAQKGVVD